MEKEYIKIPTDFNNLLNLNEMLVHYETISDLKENLDEYQKTYFKSFLKSYYELIDYIRKDDLDNYKIRIYGNEYACHKMINNKIQELKNTDLLLIEFLRHITNYVKPKKDTTDIIVSELTKNKKIFLVNHKDKNIDICLGGYNIQFNHYKYDDKIKTSIKDNILTIKLNARSVNTYGDIFEEEFNFNIKNNTYIGSNE